MYIKKQGIKMIYTCDLKNKNKKKPQKKKHDYNYNGLIPLQNIYTDK